MSGDGWHCGEGSPKNVHPRPLATISGCPYSTKCTRCSLPRWPPQHSAKSLRGHCGGTSSTLNGALVCANYPAVLSRSGGTGRRVGFKIRWPLRPCGFESHLRYFPEDRGRASIRSATGAIGTAAGSAAKLLRSDIRPTGCLAGTGTAARSNVIEAHRDTPSQSFVFGDRYSSNAADNADNVPVSSSTLDNQCSKPSEFSQTSRSSDPAPWATIRSI